MSIGFSIRFSYRAFDRPWTQSNRKFLSFCLIPNGCIITLSLYLSSSSLVCCIIYYITLYINLLSFILFSLDDSIIDDDDYRPSTASSDQTRERKLAELVCRFFCISSILCIERSQLGVIFQRIPLVLPCFFCIQLPVKLVEFLIQIFSQIFVSFSPETRSLRAVLLLISISHLEAFISSEELVVFFSI